jgi:hypothetical protein
MRSSGWPCPAQVRPICGGPQRQWVFWPLVSDRLVKSTTSTSKSGGVAGTGATSTTRRVAAPNSSTTATTAAPSTTTTTPPTTTSTAPDRDQRVAVDFAPRLDGAGGWLVRRDGSVTALGSARSLGDAAGRIHDDAVGRFPNEAIGIATTPSGAGYWIATARGEVFPFGDAGDRGSLGKVALAQPIVAFTATHSGDGAQGYLMTDARGSVYNFSSVAVPGLPPGYDRPDPVVAIAAAPDGPGCCCCNATERSPPLPLPSSWRNRRPRPVGRPSTSALLPVAMVTGC